MSHIPHLTPGLLLACLIGMSLGACLIATALRSRRPR